MVDECATDELYSLRNRHAKELSGISKTFPIYLAGVWRRTTPDMLLISLRLLRLIVELNQAVGQISVTSLWHFQPAHHRWGVRQPLRHR